jgi:hypothetical protein
MEAYACLLAFVITALAARHSLGWGLVAVAAVGYVQGVFRANYLGWLSVFFFDSAVLALYLSVMVRPLRPAAQEILRPLHHWLLALFFWPLLICLVPLQSYLIQLIGLRAAVWFLPFIVIGCRCGPRDLITLTRGLAVLNLLALLVAIYLYVAGVGALFPRNTFTQLIYMSNDVAGYTAHRIPATFANAHAYGTTMLMTLPLLIGRAWVAQIFLRERLLLLSGALAAGLGVFLCGARTPVVLLLMALLLLLLLSGLSFRLLALLGILMGIVGFFVAHDVRMQRFLTMTDAEVVAQRLQLSANHKFWDLLVEYPAGAGLGRAWGTSIPSFLRHQAKPPIGLENEYSRILIEQGLVGLLLFLGFLFWVHRHPPYRLPLTDPSGTQTKFAYATSLTFWLTAFIGAGAFTSIPSSALALFLLGMVVRQKLIDQVQPVEKR